VVSVSRSTATVWEAATGKRELELVGHLGLVMHATWSPDGTTVVTAAADGAARIWDAKTGDQMALYRPPGRARVANFAPDGNRLVIGNDDGTAAIYEIARYHANPQELTRLLRCRVPYVVEGDRLVPRARACD
jgi:WD40 repeat protein